MGYLEDLLRQNDEEGQFADGPPMAAGQAVEQPLPNVLSKPVDDDSATPALPPPAAAPAPASGLDAIQNPMARDRVAQLYGEKYSDSARQALQDKIKQDSSGPNFRAGLAALGAGLAGRDAAGAGESVLDRQKAASQKQLSDFDTGRQTLLANNDTNNKLRDDAQSQELLAREKDPNSAESKIAQELATKIGLDPAVASKMTAAQWKQSSPAAEKMYQVQQNAQARRDMLAERTMTHNDALGVRQDALSAKNDEKMEGLKTPFGLAHTAQDAKDLKAANDAKSSFDAKLQDMIDLRDKHSGGAILNRDDVARGKQLSTELLNEYRNLSKLRMLNPNTQKLIGEIIPTDPLAYTSPLAAVQGQDPIMTKLKQFKADTDRDFSTRVSSRIRAGTGGVADGASDGPQGKTVMMRDPKGVIRHVPASMVSEAQKAGGTVVDDVASESSGRW